MSVTAQTRNPRGEGERLRGALLTAAGELLSEDPDVDHLSVRAITARAGVTHTAMYLHFADKQTLIEEVKMRCFGDLAEALADAVGGAAETPAARLQAVGKAYLRFAAARPGHYAVMFHMSRPGVTDTPEHVRAAGMHAFHQLVTLAATAVGEADARDAAADFWLAHHGRASIRRSMPWFPMAEETAFVRAQVDALLSRRGPT